MQLLFKIEAAYRHGAGKHKDPGLVARHIGAPGPAARRPQCLDHSVLVEADHGQAAGEEVTEGDGLQPEANTCSCEAAVLGADVAHPEALPPKTARLQECALHLRK